MMGSTVLQDQYAELQRREQLQALQREQQIRQHQDLQQHEFQDNYAGYSASEDGGLVVIDNDDNPGLRGGDMSNTAHGSGGSDMRLGGEIVNMPRSTVGSGSLYSASHITSRYGSGTFRQSAASFPALSRPVNGQKKSGKPLSRSTGAVKRTTPEDAQKLWSNLRQKQ